VKLWVPWISVFVSQMLGQCYVISVIIQAFRLLMFDTAFCFEFEMVTSVVVEMMSLQWKINWHCFVAEVRLVNVTLLWYWCSGPTVFSQKWFAAVEVWTYLFSCSPIHTALNIETLGIIKKIISYSHTRSILMAVSKKTWICGCSLILILHWSKPEHIVRKCQISS